MKKYLLALLFFPLISSSVKVESTTGNNVVVNNSSYTEVDSEGKTESEIITEINGKKTIIKTDQPGTLEVNASEEKTEIKTSEGITPTIIKIQPTSSEVEERNDLKEIKTVFISIKKFFSNIFSSIFNKT